MMWKVFLDIDGQDPTSPVAIFCHMNNKTFLDGPSLGKNHFQLLENEIGKKSILVDNEK